VKPGATFSDARQVLTGAQCKEARRLLRLSPEALARAAIAHPLTIERFESRGTATFPIQSKLRAVLEAAGVEFPSEGQPGVRMRKR
jgi:hypothetical protein